MLDIYIFCEYNIHIMNIKYRLFLAVLSIASLFTGLLVYVFFRESTYIHLMLNKIGLEIDFYNLKVNNGFVSFLKYYLVDYLWCFSLSFLLSAISYELKFTTIISNSLLATFLGIFFEWAQKIGLINGTADFCDLVMYVLAGFCHAFINIKLSNKAFCRRE